MIFESYMDALEYLIVTYINYQQFLFYMYAVIVFALALLSPLPFVSPFDNIVQDATAQNIPPGAPSFEIIPHLIPSPFGSIMQDPNDPHFIEYP